MRRLNKVLKFIDLTHKLQKIQRVILVRNENRMENDLEHQYQLAILAWYIIDSEKLKLNLNKVIKYSLVHDIVEAYAGDTFFFDDEKRKSKKDREQKAMLILQKEYPEFKELHKLVQGYEAKMDNESKFVYALDKIIPMYNIYLDGGRIWRKENISLADIKTRKKNLVAISPIPKKYFRELVSKLRKERSELFNEA